MHARLVFPVVAALVLGAAAQAQTKAETRRQSDRLVTFRVTLPDATSTQLTAPEGELARVTHTGATLGITAQIQDEAKGVVLFRIFEIKTRLSGSESMKQLEVIQHELGQPPTVTSGTPALELSVLRIKPKQRAGLEPASAQHAPMWGGKCCVTCTSSGGGGSTTACACAVVMECGECCAGECC